MALGIPTSHSLKTGLDGLLRAGAMYSFKATGTREDRCQAAEFYYLFQAGSRSRSDTPDGSRTERVRSA